MCAQPSGLGSVENLLRFATNLRVAHHIPGRVRLKLAAEGASGLAQVISEAKRFGQSVNKVAGIRSVNLNPLAQSCTIEYDAKVIPPEVWQDLVCGTRSAAVDIFLQALVET